MNESFRYDKDLGNAAIYVRLLSDGQFYDFVGLVFTAAACRCALSVMAQGQHHLPRRSSGSPRQIV
jgi:hypothetical protein